MESTASKFKFCYILRGLPGSGKSTVAKQLAGEKGVILHFDKNDLSILLKKNKSTEDELTYNKHRDEFMQEFKGEINKNT